MRICRVLHGGFLQCLDSRGSHREPCHLAAYGNRQASAHLCKHPCGGRQNHTGQSRQYNGMAMGQKQVWFQKRPVHLKQPQAMGGTDLEIVTDCKQVRFHPYAVWSSLARTDSHRFLAPCCVCWRCLFGTG